VRLSTAENMAAKGGKMQQMVEMNLKHIQLFYIKFSCTICKLRHTKMKQPTMNITAVICK